MQNTAKCKDALITNWGIEMNIQIRIYIFSILMLLSSVVNSAPRISEPLKLESSKEFSCGPNKALVEVYGGVPADWFDAKRVVVKFTSPTGEESKLTYLAGSFGIHCPKHPLNFQGYFVFQIACPSKDFPNDAPPPCDVKNNFGVVSDAEVLIVPHQKNGKLAAELFNVSPKIKSPLEPVPTLFNVNLSPQSTSVPK